MFICITTYSTILRFNVTKMSHEIKFDIKLLFIYLFFIKLYYFDSYGFYIYLEVHFRF